MICSDTKYNEGPWEWRTLGVVYPGSGRPWEWWTLELANRNQYVTQLTLFWTNFDSPYCPLSNISGPPLKYVTHLGPPIFSNTCICIYRGFVLVHGVLMRVFCPVFFCLECF